MRALILTIVFTFAVNANAQTLRPGGGSAAPSGSAGGDLTGTYPNPTIAADAVTYAKMQNVSAAARILGGPVGGAGNVEEIPFTASARTATAITAVRGDIFYASAAATWARLPIGSNTHVLTSDGTDISWQAAAAGGANPAGGGTELQYRVNGTTFGAIATSSHTVATGATVLAPVSPSGDILTIAPSGSPTGHALKIAHTGALGKYGLYMTGSVIGDTAMMRLEPTGSGVAGAQSEVGTQVIFAAGYNGTGPSVAGDFENANAGTGNDLRLSTSAVNPYGNSGFNGMSTGVTTGANFGGFAEAANGTLSIALGAKSTTLKNAGTNIGLAAFALNAGTTPIQIGAFIGLMDSTPTFTGLSAGAVISNGTTTSPILLLQDGTSPSTVFSVADGGAVVSTSTSFTIGGAGTMTWPSSNAAGSLTNNGSGTLTWTAAPADVTLAAIDSAGSANANGATLTAQVLNLRSATTSFGGVVTTGTQSFAGEKTFAPVSPANSVTIAPSGTPTGHTLVLTSGTLAANKYALTATGVPHSGPLIRIDATGNSGHTTQNNLGAQLIFGAGYTGSGITIAGDFENINAGTGTNLKLDTSTANPIANSGLNGSAYATTTGTNIGGYFEGALGNVSIGVIGKSITTKNSATNIGLLAAALNAGTTPIQIGAFIGLVNSTPTFTGLSAGLVVTNGAIAAPIVIFRDNTTTVWQVDDGGNITATGYGMTKSGTGTVTAGDCDDAAEAGRFYIETDTAIVSFCTGAAWKSITFL